MHLQITLQDTEWCNGSIINLNLNSQILCNILIQVFEIVKK